MTKATDPAFPIATSVRVHADGVSLRAYIATTLLSGILACAREFQVVDDARPADKTRARAKIALDHADALLDEIERKPPKGGAA